MSDVDPVVEQLQEAVYAGDLLRIRTLTDGLTEAERTRLRKPLAASNRYLIGDLIAHTEGKFLPPDPLRQAALNRVVGRTEFRRAGEAAALLLTAIGNSAQAEWSVLKFPAKWRGYDFDTPTRDRFTYHAGSSLARRPEAWTKELLPKSIHSLEHHAYYVDPPLTLAEDLLDGGFLSAEKLASIVAANARDYRLDELDWEKPYWRLAIAASLETRQEPVLATRPFCQKLGAKLKTAFASGRLDREHFLTLGLERLGEAVHRDVAVWWGQFVDLMEPSAEDWRQRPHLALDLLAAPTQRAAGVGLEAAKKLFAAKAIPPTELVPALAAAVQSEAIGVARGAVELLRRCAERDRTVELEAIQAGIGALSHPKSAVAEAYLAWLELNTGWRGHMEVEDALFDGAGDLPEAAAARVRALLGEKPAMEDGSTLAVDETSLLRSVSDRVREMLAAEREPQRLSLLQACAEVMEGRTVAPGALEVPLDGAYLSSRPYYVPESAETLAYWLLKVGEDWSHPANLEPILAAMRRPMSADEARMAMRLLDPKLPLEIQQRRPAVFTWGCFWQNTTLRTYGDTFAHFQITANLQAVKVGVATPPLSLPTHPDGWLDPRVLAERVCQTTVWQDRTLFELSSALYRVFPDASLRGEAWSLLDSALKRLPRPVPDALAVALGPERDVQGAGRRLLEWAASRGLNPFEIEKGLPLRLLCSAARARYGAKAAPFLQAMRRNTLAPGVVRAGTWRIVEALANYGTPNSETVEKLTPAPLSGLGQLVYAVRFYFDRPEPNPDPAIEEQQEWRAWSRFPEGLFPELDLRRPYAHTATPAAFAFPAGIGRMLEDSAKQELGFDGSVLVPILQIARRRHVDLRSHLPAILTHAKHDKAYVREEACSLLQHGFADGRLHSGELMEALSADLTREETRSKGILSALASFTEGDAAFRDLMATVIERCLVSASPEAFTGAERVGMLERLQAWRAAAGRGIEDAAAKAAFEALAGAKAASRSRELARLLLRLPNQNGRPSAIQMLAVRDVDLTLSLLSSTGGSS